MCLWHDRAPFFDGVRIELWCCDQHRCAMLREPPSHADLYAQVKTTLLAGNLAADLRIDVQHLADQHRVSTTPIREVLFRLSGERLVELHPSGGFRLWKEDARSLYDLYTWNGQHLLAAVHLLPDPVMRKAIQPFAASFRGTAMLDPVDLTERLFRALAAATGNGQFVIEMEGANDRLRRARLAEGKLFPDRPKELLSLIKSNGFDVRNNVRRRIAAYHRRRAEQAAQIAALSG